MIDSAGTNHFVTVMILFYELELYSKNRYLTYKSTYFPQGRREGTAIYAKVHVCASVKGMVFKQFTLG